MGRVCCSTCLCFGIIDYTPQALHPRLYIPRRCLTGYTSLYWITHCIYQYNMWLHTSALRIINRTTQPASPITHVSITSPTTHLSTPPLITYLSTPCRTTRLNAAWLFYLEQNIYICFLDFKFKCFVIPLMTHWLFLWLSNMVSVSRPMYCIISMAACINSIYYY